MKKEEILRKIEDGEVTVEDLFAYYGVRNLEGLEMALEEKFAKPKVNINYIIEGPAFIYKSRQKDEYNPLEEKMFFFSIIFAAFYEMELDEATIIIRSMGLFEGPMMLDKLLQDKPEIKYFKHLYQMYVEKQTDTAYALSVYADKAVAFLVEKLENLDVKDLEKLAQSVIGEVEKITTKI